MQGVLGGRREIRKKICKTNKPRCQPARGPRIRSEKKNMEELLSRPRRALKTFIVSFPPNAPHNTMRNHFPDHRE
jgi:hypothetical protein